MFPGYLESPMGVEGTLWQVLTRSHQCKWLPKRWWYLDQNFRCNTRWFPGPTHVTYSISVIRRTGIFKQECRNLVQTNSFCYSIFIHGWLQHGKSALQGAVICKMLMNMIIILLLSRFVHVLTSIKVNNEFFLPFQFTFSSFCKYLAKRTYQNIWKFQFHVQIVKCIIIIISSPLHCVHRPVTSCTICRTWSYIVRQA